VIFLLMTRHLEDHPAVNAPKVEEQRFRRELDRQPATRVMPPRRDWQAFSFSACRQASFLLAHFC